MVIPSSDQPCESATSCSSSRVSERVMYRTGSPSLAPSRKNWSDSVVLPDPGTPSIKYNRLGRKPPPSTLSSPSMPEAAKGFFGSEETKGADAMKILFGSASTLVETPPGKGAFEK